MTPPTTANEAAAANGVPDRDRASRLREQVTNKYDIPPDEFGKQIAKKHIGMIDEVLKEWRMERDSNEYYAARDRYFALGDEQYTELVTARKELARLRAFVALTLANCELYDRNNSEAPLQALENIERHAALLSAASAPPPDAGGNDANGDVNGEAGE